MTKRYVLIAACMICSLAAQSQTPEELKQQKMAEREAKLTEAKHRAAQEAAVYSYHGGTLAPFGFAFYTMNPDRIGFYASVRGWKGRDGSRFKGLNLNFGITQNLFYPVGMYVAGGISDYEVTAELPNKWDLEPGWEMGFDSSFGLIFHIRGLELQTGVSLFNFSRPEFCFGLGINILRRKDL